MWVGESIILMIVAPFYVVARWSFLLSLYDFGSMIRKITAIPTETWVVNMSKALLGSYIEAYKS